MKKRPQAIIQASGAHEMLRYLWRRTGRPLLGAAERTVRVLRNAAMLLVRHPDYKRWGSPGGLEEWWDERTKTIARLVPADSRVIEFGAGRRQLEKFLPAGCSYIPSDLIDRGPDTVVCDLNHRPLPDICSLMPNVAVFSGVLEYVRDVPTLAQWLAGSGAKMCVASFDPVPAKLGIIARSREITRRRYNGYMNNLTEEELLRGFMAAGYACIRKDIWTTQLIFVFSQSKSGSGQAL